MAESKVPVTLRIEEPLHALIAELAFQQHRTVSNFITQFLSVSLQGDLDRVALVKAMNPSFSAMPPEIADVMARSMAR